MIVLKADELENFNNKKGTSVTIGKFDGIHLGHRALIDETIRYAKYSDLLSCVVTFNNIMSSSDDRILTTLYEKRLLLEKMGVDVMVVLEFTDVLKDMNPYEFIDFFLVDMLNAGSVTVGSDFRFGRRREGSIKNFSAAQMVYGFDLTVMEKEKYDGEEISSTLIRNYIKSGDIEKANSLLGYNYLIAGVTESGEKKGRQIGVPTINLYPEPEKLMPPFGVYSSSVMLDGKRYKAVTNIGVCPTIKENKEVSVETHIIGYNSDKELYGEEFSVYLSDFIRGEKKFASAQELYEQMQADIKEAAGK